jgi:hypothetical protein
VHRIVRVVLAAIPIAASLHAPPAPAEVIDDIAVERHESGARIRLRLTGPVHYIRDFASPDGETVNVTLQSLGPVTFARGAFFDEVRLSPQDPAVPRFAVRVSLDPRCDPAPSPVCVLIRFERPVRCRVRLGEDRRSLLLAVASRGEEGPPRKVREKP